MGPQQLGTDAVLHRLSELAHQPVHLFHGGLRLSTGALMALLGHRRQDYFAFADPPWRPSTERSPPAQP